MDLEISALQIVLVSEYFLHDEIIGNNVTNILNGNSGNDTLTGGAGSDTLNGGAGTDTAIFSGSKS